MIEFRVPLRVKEMEELAKNFRISSSGLRVKEELDDG